MRPVQFPARVVPLLIVGLSAAEQLAAQPSDSEPLITFQGLGDLPGGDVFSEAWGVSGDGRAVVGFSSSVASVNNPPLPGDRDGTPFRGFEAFIWTPQTGMVGLGDLPGDPYFHSFAYDMSDDGTTAVGGSMSERSLEGVFPGYEGFRWRAETGMMGIGVIPNSIQQTTPVYGVSRDGSVLVGRASVSDGYQAFRWTEARGFDLLGNLDGPVKIGIGWGISADGRVIVGWDNARDSERREGNCVKPAILNTSTGWRILDDRCGTAFAASADGTIQVGRVGTHAVAWIGGEAITLGEPPTDRFTGSQAMDISADGSVIVGFGTVEGEPHNTPFLWRADTGIVLLRDLLTDVQIDATGWSLRLATAVSADGSTIVGIGVNPEGQSEVWRISIAPVATSRAALTGVTIHVGEWLSGNIESLAMSDQSFVHAASGFGRTRLEVHELDVQISAATRVLAPSTLDLTIESSIDGRSGIAHIAFWNWRTGAFDPIHRYALGATERIVTVRDIDATDYVTEDGEILLQIRHVVFVPFLGDDFVSNFDHIAIEVQ